MGGLARILKVYGQMEVEDKDGNRVVWIYDYAKDIPRLKSETTKEEIAASEKAKYLLIKNSLEKYQEERVKMLNVGDRVFKASGEFMGEIQSYCLEKNQIRLSLANDVFEHNLQSILHGLENDVFYLNEKSKPIDPIF